VTGYLKLSSSIVYRGILREVHAKRNLYTVGAAYMCKTNTGTVAFTPSLSHSSHSQHNQGICVYYSLCTLQVIRVYKMHMFTLDSSNAFAFDALFCAAVHLYV
jgi:hypothetical protein